MSTDVPDLPNTFITLEAAFAETTPKNYNVIGVCVDFLPAAKSRGSDHTIKFSLHDHSWSHGHYDRGMTFRFFHKLVDQLPAIKHTGDICLLKNVKTKDIQGQIGISTFQSSWVILSGSSVIDSTCPNGSDVRFVKSERAFSPSVAELQYAKHIATQADPSGFRTPATATSLQVASIMQEHGGQPTQMPGKRRLLEQLTLSKANPGKFENGRPAFADLVGEVRRLYPGDYQKVELYLTDYTTHPNLYNYSNEPGARDGDEFNYTKSQQNWPGPWGRMTLKILCWDVNAEFARTNIKEGMLVLIKNCNIKYDSYGSSLEAICHGDRDEASKVNIIILQAHEATKDDDLKGLLQRRRDYERLAAQKGLTFKLSATSSSKKRTLDDAMVDTHVEKSEDPKQLTKAQKRKQKKKAKQQSEQSVKGPIMTSNQNVRCNQIEVTNKTIDSILDANTLKRSTPDGNSYHLPFQNCCYKAKVRVVDFFPHDIADFAVPRQSSQYDALSDDDEMDDAETLERLAQSNPESIEWEWRFMLIVEDATVQPLDKNTPRKQMPLLVAEGDAEFLLRDETACNLRINNQELARLREKLFHLWGDLQEHKEEAGLHTELGATKSQAKPFECLIKEYGVVSEDTGGDTGDAETEVPRCHRVFRMFGTTIS